MRSLLTLLIASGLAWSTGCSEPQLPEWLDEYTEAQRP